MAVIGAGVTAALDMAESSDPCIELEPCGEEVFDCDRGNFLKIFVVSTFSYYDNGFPLAKFAVLFPVLILIQKPHWEYIPFQ